MSLVAGFVVIGLILALEAFFSGSEMAMTHADRLRLEAQAAEGHAGSRLALDLLAREDRLLATCLIGTNLCTITGTTLVATLLFARGHTQEWLVALVFVPFTLILGEALPKTVFQYHASLLAPVVARPLAVCQKLFSPFLVVVGGWTGLLSRMVGTGSRPPITRQEILALLEPGDEPSGLDPEDQQLIRRVFAINEVQVEACMTPLVDVYAIPESATIDEAVAVAVDSGHSRLPVFRERIDNLVGVLLAKDLLLEPDGVRTIDGLFQPIPFVPETKRIDELLHEMRLKGQPFAAVVDEYGGAVGVVSIEDLLEEIVGEIRDERDEVEPSIRRVGEREWKVPARVEVDVLSETLGRELPEGDYETVAGLLLSRLGRIPLPGETLALGDGTIFRIDEASDRAILQVTVTVPPPDP